MAVSNDCSEPVLFCLHDRWPATGKFVGTHGGEDYRIRFSLRQDAHVDHYGLVRFTSFDWACLLWPRKRANWVKNWWPRTCTTFACTTGSTKTITCGFWRTTISSPETEGFLVASIFHVIKPCFHQLRTGDHDLHALFDLACIPCLPLRRIDASPQDCGSDSGVRQDSLEPGGHVMLLRVDREHLATAPFRQFVLDLFDEFSFL